MMKKTILPLQLLVAPDKNDPAPLVLYHGRNCPDGFGAALAAWLYYGEGAEYLGLDHGDVSTLPTTPPSVRGRSLRRNAARIERAAAKAARTGDMEGSGGGDEGGDPTTGTPGFMDSSSTDPGGWGRSG